MKKLSTIQKELRKIEILLHRKRPKSMSLEQAIKRGKCQLDERTKWELYGAAQALGWVLDLDYEKASKLV